MANPDIAYQRLYNQQISMPAFETPAETVAWMGALQAQDYAGALWAIGLRTRAAAADARWMLELLAARVIAAGAPRYRQLELDDRGFARSRALFARLLEGGKQLRRDAMYERLEAGRIVTAGGGGGE